MDEVFGTENYVETIAFRTKNMTLGGTLLEGVFDYLLWYAKDKDLIKYRRVFQFTDAQGDTHWNRVETRDGHRYTLPADQISNHALIPDGAELYGLWSLY